MKRVRVLVDGRVQGVLFRESTRRKAAECGVHGFERNREDGRVEAVLEGPPVRVDALLEWIKDGPPLAAVSGVEALDEPPTGEFDSFRITA